MKVDALPFKHFMVAFCVAWGIVFVAFIAGLCGPASEVSTSSFAYNCPNDTHTWSPECKGIQPGVCCDHHVSLHCMFHQLHTFLGVNSLGKGL